MSKRQRHHDKNQEGQIDRLRQRAKQAAGGEMIAWESDALSPKDRKDFWERVLEYENAPSTTNFQQLTEIGLELPEPDSLPEEELTTKLWEVILGLARLRVFISDTDHLSDRELYTVLWREVLREETPLLPIDSRSACHRPLVNVGAEPDTHLYLKYYADEDCRRDWLEHFPDYAMPAHEDPPYDRDSQLPQPHAELARKRRRWPS